MRLRDPTESAVNGVKSCAEKSAHLYEDAAKRASDPEVRELFDRVAAERRALTRRLSDEVRSMGELPEDPDPDAEFVHRVVNAVRAFFAEEDRALLEDRERAEAELAEAIESALSVEVEGGLRRLLVVTQQRIAALRARLRSEAETDSPG
jgi:uncharacterized protein (TIGR02284 family)